ncbi:recombinase family protein [Microbispora sp. KK1-11]|uniref:recombinase family protein n=1 Tax=Microbispora sp. KK1-11 TaxID=2053005 RepID=UPI00115AE981|nr:recombinase family protein [Microbispora sp. KK1-11]TQS29996.1 recombinase family protein [Microbispora sp. KK1-11]
MKPQRAVLLLRISDDKSGDAAGVGRQEEDGRRLAHRLGWGIAHVIVENDTSAFKRRKIRLPDGTTALRTVRPGFRRGLDLLASGEADGLLAYDLDRVARDPRDLEDLIDVVESRTPRIPVESVSGSLRLANDADVTMARVMVAVANKASRDTARRVSRKHEQLAEQGRPGGGGIRAFGYERDGVTIRESEAEVVRWMAQAVLDGQSLNAIARELAARGVSTVRGGKWNIRSVWSTLTGPKIAGLRRFRGEIVGKATWPAILDMDTWEQVRQRISERALGTSNKMVRWLTGSLWCPLCQGRLTGNSVTSTRRNVGPIYWCSTERGGCGKISVRASHAEGEVERRLLDYLERPEVFQALVSAASGDSMEQVRAEVAEDEQQLKDLARMWATKQITLGEYSEARRIIDQRIKDARMYLVASAPRLLRSLLAGDVRAGWAEMEPVDRRDVLAAVIPDGFWVYPAEKRRVFDPNRIRLRQLPEA